MKKTIAILLAVAVLFTFAACGKKDAQPSAGMPNPMREASADEMEYYVNIPEGAEDVKYFIIEDGDDDMYQVTFTLSGKDYCYRMQRTGEVVSYDMSGIYADKWENEDVSVNNRDAAVKTCAEGSVIYWLDVVPGINYTLSSSQQLSAAQLTETAEALFVPMQQEAAADEEYPAFTEGHYEDGNFNTVDVECAGMNVYNVTIGLYRLSSFEGEGRWEEESLKFTVEAPDGSCIDGRFFPSVDSDGFSLCFTDSGWSLLESGTTFDGFLPTEGEQAVGMPNPMREISAEEMELDVNVPEGAEDVRYFVIEAGDNNMYQVTYVLDGKDYCYRMQRTGEVVSYDMSGMYASDWETEATQVSYCDATVMTGAYGSVIYWLDVVPGVNYTLSSPEQLTAAELSEAAASLFAPMQGES